MSFISGAVTNQCSDKVHTNQDKYGILTTKDINGCEVVTALVCDGVSRSYRSELASYNTVFRLLEWAAGYFKENAFNSDRIINELDKTIRQCNAVVDKIAERYGAGELSCCTISGMVTDGKDIIVFNAGDSRIYEVDLTADKLYLLTKDDKAEDGHTISNCVGLCEGYDINVKYSRLRFNNTSVYYICTDGMYRLQSFKKWGREMCYDNDRNMIENHLSEMVNEVRAKGEMDDVTAICIVGKNNFRAAGE